MLLTLFLCNLVMREDWPVKTTAACTPKNARYPISDLTAAAGNERVRLRWTKPASERFTRYQVTVNPGNQIINLDDTSLEEYIVDGFD